MSSLSFSFFFSFSLCVCVDDDHVMSIIKEKRTVASGRKTRRKSISFVRGGSVHSVFVLITHVHVSSLHTHTVHVWCLVLLIVCVSILLHHYPRNTYSPYSLCVCCSFSLSLFVLQNTTHTFIS